MIKFIMLMLLSFGVLATDVVLTWDAPTLREDGSAITNLESYKIYYSVDNVLTPVLVIPSTELTYILVDVPYGLHTFQISSVESGLEGALSDPVSVPVNEPAQSPVAKILITVEVVD